MTNRAFINLPLRILALLWASPYTLLGLFLGCSAFARVDGPAFVAASSSSTAAA